MWRSKWASTSWTSRSVVMENCFWSPTSHAQFTRLAKRLAELGWARALIEVGSYQNVSVGARRAAELPVVIINPRRVLEIVWSMGQLPRPTISDARVLVGYCF
jgi:hypothetical protein